MSAHAISRHLVVAGDVLNDRHFYAGERNTPAMYDRRGVKLRGVKAKSQHGGAHLLNALIERALTARVDCTGWKTLLGVIPPALDAEPCGYDGYAIWQPFPKEKNPPQKNASGEVPQVWRAGRLMGYGLIAEPVSGLAAARPVADPLPHPDVLILDDAGFLFRNEIDHPSWGLVDQASDFVLLKMSEPVAQGLLWHHLQAKCLDRLVCLVSARDLRRETLSLGRGLSWEATVDDLRNALHNDPVAQQLAQARHLVVTFSADGALWLDRPEIGSARAYFCFDPTCAEGERETQFPGDSFGYHCAMSAALALGLIKHLKQHGDSAAPLDLRPAIEAGLLAMRDLKENGHGPVCETLPDGYPLERIAAKINVAYDTFDEKVVTEGRFARTAIDWPENPATADPRSIIERSQGPADASLRWKLLDLAGQIAQNGTAALTGLPHARFGKLLTVDRGEIETLRHIRQRMRAYSNDAAPKRPLSIGVFGPPGAGKSFGVEQLAAEVFGEKSWRVFNLSQFRDPGELNGAFHQIRDLTLGGLTPVVLWDEFDSRGLDWLQYLLAPMQDGRFQDEQLNHAIGKCVFIYAGGTSWSYAEFAKPPQAMAPHFRAAKGPDFVSRLDAHMDVLGPNQRTKPRKASADGKQENAEQKDRGQKDPEDDRELDKTDAGYPLRRALLIRAYLGCKAAEKVDFDPNLLHALLGVSRYRHGARSLEKLINLLSEADKRVLRRSDLPRPEQLEMHVDAAEIAQLMQGEEVAAAIHETWRALSGKKEPRFDKSYADLSEEDKEDNRAAARRMSEILELVGLGLCQAGEGSEPAVPDNEISAILNQDIERLAEAEHNRWMEHRRLVGWRYGSDRLDEARIHPALKPYAELSEKDKEKDRNSVRHYPKFAAQAKKWIVRLKPNGQADDND